MTDILALIALGLCGAALFVTAPYIRRRIRRRRRNAALVDAFNDGFRTGLDQGLRSVPRAVTDEHMQRVVDAERHGPRLDRDALWPRITTTPFTDAADAVDLFVWGRKDPISRRALFDIVDVHQGDDHDNRPPREVARHCHRCPVVHDLNKETP